MILTLESSTGVVLVIPTTALTGARQYIWYDTDGSLQRGFNYRASIRYVNNFGTGPALFSSFMTPICFADAPILLNATEDDTSSRLVWYAPIFDGQTTNGITSFKVYKNGTFITSVPPTPLSDSSFQYIVTGLQNGSSASYAVTAVNSTGESQMSSSLTSSPFGQMSIVSVVAVGKTLTATINPNGRPVDHVVFIALDQSPSASESSNCVADIPQQSISQNATGTIQVIQTFSSFSSDISFWCAIAHNEVNSVFLKSA